MYVLVKRCFERSIKRIFDVTFALKNNGLLNGLLSIVFRSRYKPFMTQVTLHHYAPAHNTTRQSQPSHLPHGLTASQPLRQFWNTLFPYGKDIISQNAALEAHPLSLEMLSYCTLGITLIVHSLARLHALPGEAQGVNHLTTFR